MRLSRLHGARAAAAASLHAAARRAAGARAQEWGWFTLYLPGIERPLFARPGTSDLKSFQAIFGRRQHDLPFSADPSVIFDVGANVGYSTVDLALRFPDASTIVAVEAEASNVHVLRENVAGFPQIDPVHAAVWPHGGQLAVEDVGRDKWGFQVRDAGEAADAVEVVDAVTLPELMERAGVEAVDLLKVDVEGAEHELLAEGPDWLRDVGAIVIELHETRPGASEATASTLARYGFEELGRREENRYYRARRRLPQRRPPSSRRPASARRRRPALRVAAAAAAAVLVFGLAPEALGDWPYNPFGVDSHAHAGW